LQGHGNAVEGVCVITANPKAQAPRLRGPIKFKQRDLTRALKATKAAGHVAARVEIIDPKGGKIVLILSDEKPTPLSTQDDWDKALSNDR
jgi:hypothetical protein